MKAVTLVLASMIVTIGCTKSLYELRERKAWDNNAITSVIAITSDVWKFKRKFQDNYNYMGLFISKMVLKRPTDVTFAAPIHLKWILANTCFDYLLTHLLEFTGAVLELLKTENAVIDVETKELIGFDDHVYSLPAFLFDVGYRNLKPIIDIIHFLRTLTLPPPLNMATGFILQTKFRKFIEENSFQKKHNKGTNFKKYSEIASRNILKKKCLEIKTKITSLSGIFLPYTTPLINTKLYDRKFQYEFKCQLSAFGKYIYETEMFSTDWSWSSNDTITQNSKIIDWNCNAILESPEYGFDEHSPPITDKRHLSNIEKPMLSKKIQSQTHEEDKRPTQSDENTSIYEMKPINLITLKNILLSNSYYLNVVQYYSIEANVIIFASIKEGRKILKAIKYELDTSNSPPRCSFENVKEMRSKLLWLKMTFDQLFIALEEKQLLFIDKNHQTSDFLKLVDSVLDTLSSLIVTNKSAVKKICLTVSVKLAHITDPILEESLDRMGRSIEYYLIKPFLHLHSLY